MEKDCQKRGKKGIGDWGPGNRETGSTIQRVDEIAIVTNNNPYSLVPSPYPGIYQISITRYF